MRYKTISELSQIHKLRASTLRVYLAGKEVRKIKSTKKYCAEDVERVLAERRKKKEPNNE